MNGACLAQLTSFWPDAVERFRDVVPDDCLPVRFRDEWTELPTRFDRRRRRIDLLGEHEDITELCEDAVVNAQGDGWRLVEHVEEPLRAVLEHGEETLEVSDDRYTADGVDTPVLRIDLEQPWRSDVEPPVESSELFIEACRKVLDIDEFPIFLEKDVVLEPGPTWKMIWMHERIRFSSGDGQRQIPGLAPAVLRARISAAGYVPQDREERIWHARSMFEAYEAIAIATLMPDQVELMVTRARPSAPAASS